MMIAKEGKMLFHCKCQQHNQHRDYKEQAKNFLFQNFK